MAYDDNVKRVKEAANIVNIIGEFVDLKKAGKNYKGLCPFHKEKTPSFVVSEERQTFKCFGCGETGDVLSFIMKRDGLEFKEALNYLADKVGVTLDNSIETRRTKISLEKYYRINEEVRRFYYQNLLTSKVARDYLRKRQISDKSINDFSLGFAPDSWDMLYNYMIKKGYAVEDLLELGLIGKSQHGNYYDKYRNRIIFPIIDTRDRVIGFGGRTLGDDKAKYINSSESVIYHKSDNLYALNLIHRSNYRDKIMLVEGYLDVIALHQAGMTYAVAALGTALTENQAKIVSRYGKEIYVCYDSDGAGIAASNRAIEVFRTLDISPHIVKLGMGMDPDDFIKAHGREVFEARLKNSDDPILFQFEQFIGGANVKDPLVLDGIKDKFLDKLLSINSLVVRERYAEIAADMLSISLESLKNDLHYRSKEQVQKARFYPRQEENRQKNALQKLTINSIMYSLDNNIWYVELREFLASEPILKDLVQRLDFLFGQGAEKVTLEDIEDYLDPASYKAINDAKGFVKLDSDSYKELYSRQKRKKLEDKRDKLQEEISMIQALVNSDEGKGYANELKNKTTELLTVMKELKTKF